MSDNFFPYCYDRRFKPLLQAFGVRPERDGVKVSRTGDFVAAFGRLRLVTPFANVAGAHITERYAWHKAIGLPGERAAGARATRALRAHRHRR